MRHCLVSPNVYPCRSIAYGVTAIFAKSSVGAAAYLACPEPRRIRDPSVPSDREFCIQTPLYPLVTAGGPAVSVGTPDHSALHIVRRLAATVPAVLPRLLYRRSPSTYVVHLDT